MSDELGRVFPTAARSIAAAGWVESAANVTEGAVPKTPPCVALAAQCLPDAETVAARSISLWARNAADWLIARLVGNSGPWRLHVFCIPATEGSATPARCEYIRQCIADMLRKKQRRLVRMWNHDPQSPLGADDWLLQIGLRTATTGYFSALAPDDRARLRRMVSRFPGGVVAVPPDRRAPSRAFAKLAEVELRLGRPIMPGETCVDLGSSPGSWAWWALKRGAQVVAVDRSPLRSDLMRSAALSFVHGDAFRYRPTRPVGWLLCDVIAFPAKTISLIERWLDEGWCRWFCVTIKFRGEQEYDRLEGLKTRFASSGYDFYLRRLTANKNEVMLFGRRLATDGDLRGGL
ncbi:MAG: SAM-dependent methyltransferase [Pirellulales bacterium]